MEQPLICPNCTRAILPDHTLVFEQGPPTHLDCKQPRALSPEERILPVAYCREHPIAECKDCVARSRLRELAGVGHLRLRELAVEPVSSRIQLCPSCRGDFTDSVRAHIDNCALGPEEVRRRAQAARENTAPRQPDPRATDAANVLMRVQVEARFFAEIGDKNRIDAPPESRSARRRRGSDMDTNAAGGSVERTR
jgi:hypothetical protein